MKQIARACVVMLVVAGLTGCVSRDEINEIKENQGKILKKLDEVAKAGPAARKQPQRRAGPDAAKTYGFPIKKDHNTTGNDDAWVTIVEISEFQCPFCKRVGPTLKQIKDKYGKEVRIAFNHNPLSFHKRAMPAAMGSECAGEQGKFWEYHDLIFENQKALEDANLKGYATKSGIDVGKWEACYKSNKYQSKILGEQKLAAKFGARGTPAFFVNGRFLSGAQPFPAFEKLIEEELKKAKASGIAKGDYYAKNIVAKGAQKL